MKRKAFLFLFSFLFLKISAQLCTNELPVSFYSTIDEQEIVERKCMPGIYIAVAQVDGQYVSSKFVVSK